MCGGGISCHLYDSMLQAWHKALDELQWTWLPAKLVGLIRVERQGPTISLLNLTIQLPNNNVKKRIDTNHTSYHPLKKYFLSFTTHTKTSRSLYLHHLEQHHLNFIHYISHFLYFRNHINRSSRNRFFPIKYWLVCTLQILIKYVLINISLELQMPNKSKLQSSPIFAQKISFVYLLSFFNGRQLFLFIAGFTAAIRRRLGQTGDRRERADVKGRMLLRLLGVRAWRRRPSVTWAVAACHGTLGDGVAPCASDEKEYSRFSIDPLYFIGPLTINCWRCSEHFRLLNLAFSVIYRALLKTVSGHVQCKYHNTVLQT